VKESATPEVQHAQTRRNAGACAKRWGFSNVNNLT